MSEIARPTRVQIEKIAAHKPDLLNPLYAFFVMGWLSVRIGGGLHPHTGMDFLKKNRTVPDYVRYLGLGSVVWGLFYAPESRDPFGPSGIDTLAEGMES